VRAVCEDRGVTGFVLGIRFASTAVEKESKTSHINSSVDTYKYTAKPPFTHTSSVYDSRSEVRNPELRERVKHELPFPLRHVVHRLGGKRRSIAWLGILRQQIPTAWHIWMA
jgi:hypothetical protein